MIGATAATATNRHYTAQVQAEELRRNRFGSFEASGYLSQTSAFPGQMTSQLIHGQAENNLVEMLEGGGRLGQQQHVRGVLIDAGLPIDSPIKFQNTGRHGMIATQFSKVKTHSNETNAYRDEE